MTLAIPAQRVRLYRVLWQRWIIVLRILFDLGAGAHPVKWQAVSDVLMVDKKTSQKYLSGLVRDGHLAIAGNGYMLTDAGMAFLRDANQGEFLPLGGKNPGENFSPLVVEVVNTEFSEEVKLTPTTPESGKIPGEIFSPLAKLIFEHIPDIFDGSQLITNKLPWTLDDFQDTLLLGWIAYAYDKRTSLSSPVGLIYRKLQSDERPSIKYLESPEEYLPESFLDAIGLWRKTCPVCENEFESKQAYDDHFAACLAKGRPFEEEPEEPVQLGTPDETVTEGVVRMWQGVLDGLKEDMPRASFDTWVRDTHVLHVDAGCVKVSTRNQYARDWLADRLTQKIEKILGRSVEFVVACVSAETESS